MAVTGKEVVSLIIPAYQEEKRIERCLRNILASTYRYLELIVVNDGSTDRTEAIVRHLKEINASAERVIEIVNIDHGGSGRARNFGLRRAEGKYIGFVDADDMIHPQMIERLVQSLQEGNDMASCGLLFCEEDGKAGLRQSRLHKSKIACPLPALGTVMWEQIQMNMGSVLFHRERVMDEEGELSVSCPENVVAFEDFAFICRYLSRCDGLWEVLPFYGYFYCRRKGSLSSQAWSARELSDALQPILAVGEMTGKEAFDSHKLQYAFRFMAHWYEEAFRCRRQDFLVDSDERKICMQELERYADIYMKSSKVSRYRKAAMWIVRRHPKTGFFLAKTVGRLLLFKKR